MAVSWWVIRLNLPADHPGLRHPRVPADADRGVAKVDG
jgi:hypothetical protein